MKLTPDMLKPFRHTISSTAGYGHSMRLEMEVIPADLSETVVPAYIVTKDGIEIRKTRSLTYALQTWNENL